MTSVKPFVFVLHFINNKDAVEYITLRTALVHASPYRGSVIYLERKCITDVVVVMVCV